MQEKKRKFQRVPIDNHFLEEVKPFVGAKARWGVFEDVPVLDLSFRGAALARPKQGMFKKDDHIQIEFQFPENNNIVIPSRIAWANEKVVGVEFSPVTNEMRLALEKYLNEKLIGVMLRRINPKFIAGYNDMDVWFNGPNYTNVFLWQKNEDLKKAIIELAEEVVVFENGEFKQFDRSRSDGSLSESGQPVSRVLAKKLVNLLGLVQDSEGVLKPLLKILVQRA